MILYLHEESYILLNARLLLVIEYFYSIMELLVSPQQRIWRLLPPPHAVSSWPRIPPLVTAWAEVLSLIPKHFCFNSNNMFSFLVISNNIDTNYIHMRCGHAWRNLSVSWFLYPHGSHLSPLLCLGCLVTAYFPCYDNWQIWRGSRKTPGLNMVLFDMCK